MITEYVGRHRADDYLASALDYFKANANRPYVGRHRAALIPVARITVIRADSDDWLYV